MTTDAAPNATADTQAPASIADTQAPPPGAGTDGKEPASLQDSAVQTAPDKASSTDVTKPEATAPSPPAKTEEEIRADIARKDAAEARQKAITERTEDLRKFRQSAPITARDLMDQLGEALGMTIPVELRKPFLDLIETSNLKSYDAAKVAVADEAGEGQQNATRVLAETSNAFYDALDETERQAFSDAVRGKDAPEWVKEYGTRKEAAGAAKARADFVTEAGKTLGEEARGKFAETAKDAKTLPALVAAFHAAARDEGNAMPPGAPHITPSGGGSGRYRNLTELNTARLSGDLRGDENSAKYLAEMNKLLKVD